MAEQIVRIVSMETLPPSSVYNLGFDEYVSISELLQMIGECTAFSANFKAVKNGHSSHYYPSVECGVISSERAKREIGWSPKPIVQLAVI